MTLKVERGSLPGVLIIQPQTYVDSRGYFKELFNTESYTDLELCGEFVQDNFSYSKGGVLRGLHFQRNNPQGKLVTCLSGAVFDVVVDVRASSPTYGEWLGVELSGSNHKQLWVPPGYAHGFCVISDAACFHYKCSSHYDPSDEAGVYWADESIGIKWPLSSPSVSKKDACLPRLMNL